MASDITPPDFVYRLATGDEWVEAQASNVVPTRDIDKRDGYIHLSTREQALETANIHFASEQDLLALVIPYERVSALTKFELAPKRGKYFPHLYGALTVEHISRAIKLVRGGDGFSFGEEL